VLIATRHDRHAALAAAALKAASTCSWRSRSLLIWTACGPSPWRCARRRGACCRSASTAPRAGLRSGREALRFGAAARDGRARERRDAGTGPLALDADFGGGRIVGEACHFVTSPSTGRGPPSSASTRRRRAGPRREARRGEQDASARSPSRRLRSLDRLHLARRQGLRQGAARDLRRRALAVIDDFHSIVTRSGGREQTQKFRAPPRARRRSSRSSPTCASPCAGPGPVPRAALLSSLATVRLMDSLRTANRRTSGWRISYERVIERLRREPLTRIVAFARRTPSAPCTTRPPQLGDWLDVACARTTARPPRRQRGDLGDTRAACCRASIATSGTTRMRSSSRPAGTTATRRTGFGGGVRREPQLHRRQCRDAGACTVIVQTYYSVTSRRAHRANRTGPRASRRSWRRSGARPRRPARIWWITWRGGAPRRTDLPAYGR